MRIVAFIFALGAAPFALPQDGDFGPLTVEQRKLNFESLEKVWTTVRDRHWDPTLGGVDWTAAHQVALLKIQSAKNMEQARSSMSEMLAKLKQSHFAIIPSDLYKEIQPASKSRAPADRLKTNARTKSAADSAKREQECGVGIEAAVVEGTARVVAIEGGSPAARAGVRTGWELISVDGFVLAETMSLLTGTDLSEREMFERALLNQPFLGPLDESVETVFRDEGGNVRQLVLDRVEPNRLRKKQIPM